MLSLDPSPTDLKIPILTLENLVNNRHNNILAVCRMALELVSEAPRNVHLDRALVEPRHCGCVVTLSLLARNLTVSLLGTMRDTGSIYKVTRGLAALEAHEDLASLSIILVCDKVAVPVNRLEREGAGVNLVRRLLHNLTRLQRKEAIATGYRIIVVSLDTVLVEARTLTALTMAHLVTD